MNKKYYCNARKHWGKAFRKSAFKHYDLPRDLVVIKGKKFIITLKEGSDDESTLWKKIGEALANKASEELFENSPKVEGVITVSRNNETAVLEADVEGDKHRFKLIDNKINTNLSKYEEKFLRKVNVVDNSHLLYDLVPNSMGPFTFDIGARYGRIGADGDDGPKVLRRPFATQLYWLRYYQKLSEGYSDETEYLECEEDLVSTLFAPAIISSDEGDASIQLYDKLMGYAKEALSEFNIDWLSGKAPYTKKQVEKCWSIWSDMYTLSTQLVEGKEDKAIEKYNNLVVDMIKIASPTFKKGVRVSSFTVKKQKAFDKTQEAFEKNIEKWEERINAMEAVMTKPKTVNGEKQKVLSPFGDVDVRDASEVELEHFKALIAKHQPSKVGMLKHVWMLTPNSRKATYERALEASENKEEQELFHGSVNANMVSLISSGGPNVRVGAANGRMFGNGSYWANDFDKSLGYTSYRGSRWAKGSEERAYMLVGKVHYGKAFVTNSWASSGDYEKKCLEEGYDCVHAKRGQWLMRDEIITYDDQHSYVEAILEIGE